MISNLKKVWATEHIRKKILITLGIVAIYKLLSVIPVPGVNVVLLEAFTEQLRLNTQLSFFGSIMGGGLEHFSIILMGLAHISMRRSSSSSSQSSSHPSNL